MKLRRLGSTLIMIAVAATVLALAGCKPERAAYALEAPNSPAQAPLAFSALTLPAWALGGAVR